MNGESRSMPPSVPQMRFGNHCAVVRKAQRGQSAGELRSDSEPDLLNDAIFGAIYYRFLLCSGPLTRRFGGELIEQVIRGTPLGKRPELTRDSGHYRCMQSGPTSP
jgi:hypothetical protein